MLWLLLAILAHTGNAVVFIIDKSLLTGSSRLSSPWRYAFYSGVLAGAAIFILPFSFTWLTPFIILWSVVAGIFHLTALWLFFIALKSQEPSRVVPLTGSAVPLFTLLFAATALGEQFSSSQLVAIGLLIIGGVLLSIKLSSSKGLSRSAFLTVITSGALFAAYFTTVKHLYDNTEPYLAVFAYARIFEAILALLIFGPFILFLRQKKPTGLSKRRAKKYLIPTVFVGSKVLAASAFILQGYAIKHGSVTVVNALQGTQYLIILILALIISRKIPKLWQEEINRVAIWQKIGGIVVISIGLILLL